MNIRLCLTIVVLTSCTATLPGQEAKILSHPVLRPLPEIARRPLAAGRGFFVDPAKGNDASEGTEATPWRSINHALKQLSAGDTLYLRGGIYREQVYCAVAGKPEAPITVRAYPGETFTMSPGCPSFSTACLSMTSIMPVPVEGRTRRR